MPRATQREDTRHFARAERVGEPREERRRSGTQERVRDEKENGNGRERNRAQPTEHLTKSGRPDRRFLDNRALPPPEDEEKQRARTGGFIGDTPVTVSGKPDLRFRENRGLSHGEVMRKFAEALMDEYGDDSHRSR